MRELVACKGICIKHKAQKPARIDLSRYAQGQKRCQVCSMFVKWDGLHCPCCGTRLRLKPKVMRLKQKIDFT